MRSTILATLFGLSCVTLSTAGGPTVGFQPRDMVLTNKTLVAWVALADLNERGVGVLAVENMVGGVDAIAYGVISPKRWMPGSDWFRRTERKQDDWPEETAGPDTFVQIAITYRALPPATDKPDAPGQTEVSLYRDGKLYAKYTAKTPMPEYGATTTISIGRHNFIVFDHGLKGKIDDARIYNVALTAEQVAALEPNKPSEPAAWAWWDFEKGPEERTGRFVTELDGDAAVKDGALVLNGRKDAAIGWPAYTGAEPAKDPPAPTEFANVYSAGYGLAKLLPADDAKFETLLVRLKKAGYNTVHCVYTPERLELCRKHGMKMMIDVLAWKEGAETDIRRPRQQPTVYDICKKVRGDDAVWGYNLWNERLDHFRPGGFLVCDGLQIILRKWDPTHPVWVGTYFSYFAHLMHGNPGCFGYYDYHWQRGLKLHFVLLPAWRKIVDKRNAYLGRWILALDYNKCMYTLNTSIPYGLKTCIWFICGPWHPAQPDRWHDNHYLCRIGREMQTLWPELGKIGRPVEVYSTPTTMSATNKPKAAGIPEVGDIYVAAAIPEDLWFQVKSGEALIGHFKYDDKSDALYVANRNAYALQDMAIAVKGTNARVDLFDRPTGTWKTLEPKDGAVHFPLAAAGGELLKVSGADKK